MERRDGSLLHRAVRGAGAGLVGTAAMSAGMLAADRVGLLGYPPPQAISEQTVQLATGSRPSAPTGRALGLLAHVGFGTAVGAAYALLPRVGRPTARGIGWALAVYAASYQAGVPALGALPPASRDRRDRVAVMVASHLVYGGVLGRTEQALRERGG